MYDNRKYFLIRYEDGSIFSFQMMSGGEKLNKFLSENTKRYKCFDSQEELNKFIKKYQAHKKKMQEFACIQLTEAKNEW